MREAIFSLNQYKVIKKFDKFTKKPGFIIVNVKQEGFAHTHLNSKDTAVCIIKNCVYKLTPQTTNLYLLKSHVRIADDKKYKSYIEDIIASIEYGVPIRYNYELYPSHK